MRKESRRREGAEIPDVLGGLVSRAHGEAGRSRDQATELAESFRRASKALESASRELVALRHRVTKPPTR